jgi:hypothetical protein
MFDGVTLAMAASGGVKCLLERKVHDSAAAVHVCMHYFVSWNLGLEQKQTQRGTAHQVGEHANMYATRLAVPRCCTVCCCLDSVNYA